MIRPATALLVLLPAVLGLCASCRSAPKSRDRALALTRHEFNGERAGRPIRLVLYAPDGAGAQSAADEVFARAEAVADLIDARRPDSELARLNDTAGGAPVIGLTED